MQSLNANQADRATEINCIEEKLKELEKQLKGFGDEAKRLRELQREQQSKLTALHSQHEIICIRREARGDDLPVFNHLAELPHQIWLSNADIPLTQLDSTALYGNNAVWQNTCGDFEAALNKLQNASVDDELRLFCATLSSERLALEHEAVWLINPAPSLSVDNV